MAKIIDRRNISMGGTSKRAVSAIKNIAIHYSATTAGSTSAFENHWRGTLGWKTGGYHEVILTNGNVELNYNADTISNGVGGQNSYIYNICYVGKGQPNAAQLKTLIERANYNRNRFGLAASAVKGHREFPGQSTACPGINMTTFRKQLSGGSVATSKDKAIEQLQKDLKALGYDPGKIDGIDGTNTQNAVKALQRAEGLTIDGIAGKITKAKIKELLNKKNASSAPKPSDKKSWRLRTGTFANANDYANAIKRLKKEYSWITYEKADSTQFDPTYRIITGTFIGKNVAQYYANQLKSKFGWTVYVDEA